MECINNNDFHFSGICLSERIPEFSLFEEKLLQIDRNSVISKYKKIKEYSAKLSMEENSMYADVQILLTYFEKLAAIEQGIADKSLFREINQHALHYYNTFPHLTSNHLLRAALAAGVCLR